MCYFKLANQTVPVAQLSLGLPVLPTSYVGVAWDTVQKITEKMQNLFGHVFRMPGDRLLKLVVFRIMERSNRRGRPRSRWADDIEE